MGDLAARLPKTKAALENVATFLLCEKCKHLSVDLYNVSLCDHVFCKNCSEEIKGNPCFLCQLPTRAKDCRPVLMVRNITPAYVKLCKRLGFTDILEKHSFRESSDTPKETLNSSPAEEWSAADHTKLTNKETESIPDKGVPKTKKKGRTSVKNCNKRNTKGETLLQVASIKGDLDKVKTLLADGADPNLKDHAGWTPLHEAVSRGFEDIASVLLDHGANVNVPGYENITPLHEAILGGNVRLVELLIASGADPHARNAKGQTPLDMAANEVVKAALKTAGSPPSRPSPVSVPVSTAAAKPSNKAITKSAVIFFLDSDKSKTQELKQNLRPLGIRVSSTLGNSSTYVVVTGTEVKDLPQFYTAILQGNFIVSSDWISECKDQGEIVDPSPYEINGKLEKVAEGSMSRLNAENQLPGLFNGCHFFLQGAFTSLTSNDIRTWIKAGGGAVISRTPNPESIPASEVTVPYHAKHNGLLSQCSHFIIYDSEAKKQPSMRYNMSHVKSLPLKWLLACIKEFQLLENFEDC